MVYSTYTRIALLFIVIVFLFSCDDDSGQYLADVQLGNYDSLTYFEYAWLFYGEREFVGRRHNNKIVEFFKSVTSSINDDETPWCSAFMNFIALKTGYEYSGSLLARSWLKVGRPLREPMPGDVVILWRGSPKSWKGHVGMFLRWSDDREKLLILGGNQFNKVGINWFPRYRVLGFRRLRKLGGDVDVHEVLDSMLMESHINK